MLDYLETFLVVAEEGTMIRAASRLRVSQPTISKRIDALERALGEKLLERDGRSLRLSPRGKHIATYGRPLLTELKNVFQRELAENKKVLSVSVSSALIVSWAPQVLRQVEQICPQVSFDIGTYSATVSVERVRAGEHLLALCHGTGASAPELALEHIIDEEMVIVPSQLKPLTLQKNGSIKIIGPEIHSESWSALGIQIDRAIRRWQIKVELERSLVSYAGIVQLARAGFGHGLVPLSVAHALAVPASAIAHFPSPGLKLPVNVLGSKTSLRSPLVEQVIREIRKAAKLALAKVAGI